MGVLSHWMRVTERSGHRRAECAGDQPVIACAPAAGTEEANSSVGARDPERERPPRPIPEVVDAVAVDPYRRRGGASQHGEGSVDFSQRYRRCRDVEHAGGAYSQLIDREGGEVADIEDLDRQVRWPRQCADPLVMHRCPPPRNPAQVLAGAQYDSRPQYKVAPREVLEYRQLGTALAPRVVVSLARVDCHNGRRLIGVRVPLPIDTAGRDVAVAPHGSGQGGSGRPHSARVAAPRVDNGIDRAHQRRERMGTGVGPIQTELRCSSWDGAVPASCAGDRPPPAEGLLGHCPADEAPAAKNEQSHNLTIRFPAGAARSYAYAARWPQQDRQVVAHHMSSLFNRWERCLGQF